MESLQHVRTNDIVPTVPANNHSTDHRTGGSGGPLMIAQSHDIHGDGNFLQGCAVSPDGWCVLTHTVADAQLRLYNTPPPTTAAAAVTNTDSTTTTTASTTTVTPWTTILSSNSGDSVRCYAWYPLMKSCDPGTCCFVAASR